MLSNNISLHQFFILIAFHWERFCYLAGWVPRATGWMLVATVKKKKPTWCHTENSCINLFAQILGTYIAITRFVCSINFFQFRRFFFVRNLHFANFQEAQLFIWLEIHISYANRVFFFAHLQRLNCFLFYDPKNISIPNCR